MNIFLPLPQPRLETLTRGHYVRILKSLYNGALVAWAGVIVGG
jgi:hypothetical protein